MYDLMFHQWAHFLSAVQRDWNLRPYSLFLVLRVVPSDEIIRKFLGHFLRISCYGYGRGLLRGLKVLAYCMQTDRQKICPHSLCIESGWLVPQNKTNHKCITKIKVSVPPLLGALARIFLGYVRSSLWVFSECLWIWPMIFYQEVDGLL